MIYCFDIDDTICTTNNKDYINSMPYYDMIERINYLHDSGNKIILFTARGMGKFNGDVKKVYEVYFDLTTNQLKEWGVKFDNLYLGKPSFDYFIDDKNLLISEFKSIINPKIGFIAGSFDVIHPGYIKMFKDIKQKCNHLLVALQIDPSIDRVEKIKPILSIDDRKEILESIKYIDEVIIYQSEFELEEILKNNKIDIRFLGDDYKDKEEYTGKKLPIKIEFLDRSHNWSTTKFKELIKNNI